MTDDLYIGPTLLAPGPGRKPGTLARIIIWPALITLFAVTILFYWISSPVLVTGNSMEPTLHDQDRVLRTKAYDEPRRGDVVIVDEDLPNLHENIVKRVVAIPGDTIEIRDDVAIVNGRTYSDYRVISAPGRGEYRPPLLVPKGYVYIMGDNRPVSLDSRFIGVVPVNQIRGKAFLVFFPLHRVGPVR